MRPNGTGQQVPWQDLNLESESWLPAQALSLARHSLRQVPASLGSAPSLWTEGALPGPALHTPHLLILPPPAAGQQAAKGPMLTALGGQCPRPRRVLVTVEEHECRRPEKPPVRGGWAGLMRLAR